MQLQSSKKHRDNLLYLFFSFTLCGILKSVIKFLKTGRFKYKKKIFTKQCFNKKKNVIKKQIKNFSLLSLLEMNKSKTIRKKKTKAIQPYYLTREYCTETVRLRNSDVILDRRSAFHIT